MSEIDGHGLFDDYQQQAEDEQGRLRALRRRYPFHLDAYPNAIRAELPGGAMLLVADDTMVIRARHLQIRYQDQWTSLSFDRAAEATALRANGYVLTFGEDTQIHRHACRSRVIGPGGDAIPSQHNCRSIRTHLVWVTGTLQGLIRP